MRNLFLALVFLSLAACDLRANDGPHEGKHRLEPDVEVSVAQWVYRDPATEQLVPILRHQAPEVGTEVGLNIGFRVVSGNDVRRITYRLVDEYGNVVVAEQEHEFQRNRELGPNRRDRSTKPMEIVVYWHQATDQKRVFAQLVTVDYFPDWNPANDSREASYRVAIPDTDPKVVNH